MRVSSQNPHNCAVCFLYLFRHVTFVTNKITVVGFLRYPHLKTKLQLQLLLSTHVARSSRTKKLKKQNLTLNDLKEV